MFDNYVKSVVLCVLLQVVSGILLPDGRVKNLVAMVNGLYLFYVLINPIKELIGLL